MVDNDDGMNGIHMSCILIGLQLDGVRCKYGRCEQSSSALMFMQQLY